MIDYVFNYIITLIKLLPILIIIRIIFDFIRSILFKDL